MSEQVHICPTCKSRGFEFSVLGSHRCTFCDGSEGGVGPETYSKLDKELEDKNRLKTGLKNPAGHERSEVLISHAQLKR